jgi:hypothetical protein
MISVLYCLALSGKEVATLVKLMFDTSLTSQDNEVLASFSSDNPPPKVIHCLASDHNVFYDNVFPFDEPRGSFLKLSRMLFCLAMMMMMLPVHQGMRIRPIERCRLLMTLKVQG